MRAQFWDFYQLIRSDEMNLKKLFNWKYDSNDQAPIMENAGDPAVSLDAIEPPSNVVPLMTNLELINEDQIGPETKAKSTPSKGLMNAPEIIEFFKGNYFGLGQHNGSNFRTQEALILGKNSLISKFQNTINDLMESKQAKINKLKDELVSIEGLSTIMTQRLEQACSHLEREIRILNEQILMAQEQKGWVLKSLNEYQIGFMKGVSDAVDFELLAN